MHAINSILYYVGSNSHQQTLNETEKIAVTSVSVFFVTFVLAFTTGFVTGHCCPNQRQLTESSESAETKLSPLYDAVQPENSNQDHVAISENIAYSTLHAT